MRKNENRVHVEGYVYQTKFPRGSLEKRVSGPNSKNPGTEFIQGRIDVLVDEDGMNVVPVYFTYVIPVFAKSGKTNATYNVLSQIIDGGDAITWLNAGPAAMKVSIDGAMELNDFVAQDGTIASPKRVRGSFCSVVGQLAPVDKRSTFRMDMVLTGCTHIEADPERNIPEDFVRLNGAAFAFNNALLPTTVEIDNPKGMEYFESLLDGADQPLYTRLDGIIINRTVMIEKEEESAFGDPIVVSVPRNERKWLVTNALKTPYEFGEEGVLTVEELTNAQQDREIHLAEVKKNNDEFRANRAVTTPTPAPSVQSPTPSAPAGRKFNF